jgi:hypothetical protein
VSGFPVSHFSEVKLQKPAPIESYATSHDPSPAGHAPSKWNAPSRPDSVPSQYVASGPAKSMVVATLAIALLRCQRCVLDGILCPTWYVCRGFHQAFPSFFTLRGFLCRLCATIP